MVYRTLACDDIDKICLVDQCKLLESEYGTSYTEKCLNNPDKTDEILAEAKRILVQEDWNKVLEWLEATGPPLIAAHLRTRDCLYLVQNLGSCLKPWCVYTGLSLHKHSSDHTQTCFRGPAMSQLSGHD